MTMDESQFVHRYTEGGGVRLHYVEMGRGQPVVMLHGFPEAWFSYRHQIPAVAAAGFRAIAPDLRGYNLSDKPAGVRAYRADAVAGDIARLVRALGDERAVVVGHDWGGGIAWTFAARHPELLDKLVILNAPHPARLVKVALTTPAQMLRSAYMLLFQLPWLPERLLAANDFAVVRRSLRRTVQPAAFSKADLDRYVAALKQPGALTAGLNYYRAAFRHRDVLRPARQPITQPVLVIWGEQDPFLMRRLAAPDPASAPNCRVEYLPDASHWVQNDQPARVNALLVAFLAA